MIRLKKYFPEDYTEKQIEDVMIKLLDDWYKKRQRKRNMNVKAVSHDIKGIPLL